MLMLLASHLVKVHDAYGLKGTVDILRKAGFGAIDFEALLFMHPLPSELYPAALTYMSSVGRYLIGRFEHYQKNKE